MKFWPKIHLLIGFIFFIYTPIFSQEFAPIGAKWYYKAKHNTITERTLLVMTCTKDTAISGFFCKKINAENFYQGGSQSLQPLLIRDTLSKLYLWNNNQFDLAIDFSSQSNDFWVLNTFNKDTAKVLSADSIIVDGVPMKRLIVYYNSNILYKDTFISRIGGLSSFLPKPLNPFNKITTYNLNCFEDSSIKFKRAKCDSVDGMIIGIAEGKNQINFTINPNPAGSYFFISSSNEILEPVRLSIYNMQGKLEMENKKYVINQKLDISNLPKGFYQVVCIVKGYEIPYKLIKL